MLIINIPYSRQRVAAPTVDAAGLPRIVGAFTLNSVGRLVFDNLNDFHSFCNIAVRFKEHSSSFISIDRNNLTRPVLTVSVGPHCMSRVPVV